MAVTQHTRLCDACTAVTHVGTFSSWVCFGTVCTQRCYDQYHILRIAVGMSCCIAVYAFKGQMLVM
jgi:hypothetical protein